MDIREINQLPIASLAYLGDAVLEVMVREKLICDGLGCVHQRAMQYVTAVVQSEAVERLLPFLSEAETAVYKRGRNHTHMSTKSSTHAQYSRATGLECLFGYLHLAGDENRLKELFDQAYH